MMVKLSTFFKNKKFATQIRNQCRLCGRKRAYIGYFKSCRMCVRKLLSNGEIPGFKKSSW